ncbi:Erythronolide synthase, modules 5 and 6 [Neorhodopirellula pilleata]|uniref:Erythronolide synthase, modules 5 and 6 n=2 Tax=Neorhodopirellula pilleata TaxID=2714738 RepID=A0A5C5ZZJ9_9BACT|nr:Erythronolide synthase, modules 5 and 6 [Neorhodopirellula pilleata]
MVGSYVMAECLRNGLNLVVLARDRGKQSASQRVEQILKRFEESWMTNLPRPQVYHCDLNRHSLGLSADAIGSINAQCGRILHSAASLSFAPANQSKENEPYRTNVEGTQRVLDFCCEHEIRNFHHVSTAYVCGKRSGVVRENESDVGQSHANDYERSKTIAEARLQDARRLGHLDALTILRPSIVIDRTGLSPISADRTIYGAFSMYQMLASRFGLPERGQWFNNLGFDGAECKNIVDVDWIAKAVRVILTTPRYHDSTYHLTTRSGTSVVDLDTAFHIATEQWLARPSRVARTSPAKLTAISGQQQAELDRMAAPFVQTFLPYFRDDPTFARDQIDRVISGTDLEPPPEIGTDELLEMVRHWSAFIPEKPDVSQNQPEHQVESDPLATDPDEVVVCGYEVRLPGGVENVHDFEEMLWEGRSGIAPMPPDRLDRSLYFDPTKGVPGKTYSQLGGCVTPSPLNHEREREIEMLGHFDLTHRQFCQVAMEAVGAAFGTHRIDQVSGIDPSRAGILVGHSGGTEMGGALAMHTLAPATAECLFETDLNAAADDSDLRTLQTELTTAIQRGRPGWKSDGSPHFNAYSVASLAGSLTGFRGRREVIDAACSSSLLALHHAVTAMQADRMDIALVGGATFNNVDNLALFSQSGACSDEGCYPFDRRASGLISSEGYVAIVLVRRSLAERLGLPICATVVGVGVASDGKGKGLWAPRSEGQQLAIRRASAAAEVPEPEGNTVLDLDYLECHATSTQVGDATELESLSALLRSNPDLVSDATLASRLPIGSAKSNLGHLLEAAGLVGLVKCLIAMKKGELPPSIQFDYPNESFEWENAPIEVVDSVRVWPQRNSKPTRVAGVNAFGIGGLNAHAIIRQSSPTRRSRSIRVAPSSPTRDRESEPIAIVGRGVILPGAENIRALTDLLQSDQTQISDPPQGRWPMRSDRSGWIGVNRSCPGSLPHCRGGYITDFRFDAQSYRIPPKTIRFANPAQLMLIQATAQALQESGVTDDLMKGKWAIDRQRIGVVIGTIFGGEFSNALQIGLRLPEIKQHVEAILRRRSEPGIPIDEVTQQLGGILMDRYPALFDETGGFTASTLASRIARTFDLMGGACAIDADEASSGLAILTAAEQLRGGHVDAVLCGMAHRSMDLVAFEQLYRKNQLVESGCQKDLPDDGSRIFPGEGVAIMMLQRLSDATSQGRPVLGIIDGETESWATDVSEARKADSRQSKSIGLASASKIVSQIGHFGGGQGIVRTIAATIAFEQNPSSPSDYAITETAQDGFQVRYQIAPPPMPVSMNQSSSRSQAGSDEVRCQDAPSVRLVASRPISESAAARSLFRYRLQSRSLDQIEHDLRHLAADPNEMVGSAVNQYFESNYPTIQAAIVGRSTEEVSQIAQALLDGPVTRRQTSALAKQCGWLRLNAENHSQRQNGDRVAWLFPGQGSQYAAIPSLLDSNVDAVAASRAHEFLGDIDSRLRARGLEPVGSRIDDPRRQLGRDIWWTQLWVLAIGATMADSLSRRGHRPDVVLGHSFGECTAAWAAGAMTIDQAIEFAKCRSDAVIMTRQVDGELLSVRGEPSAVQAVLTRQSSSAVISHHNSPTNTVIAGSRAEIAKAKASLADAGLASVVISVPAAFHTPQMKPAQDLLRARYGGQHLMPPRCGFLSAVSNRYLAEPTELMDNLIDQLTKPVCFHGALERIVAEGCGLLIEVGPDNVLTRLARATVGGRAICLSADDRQQDYHSQHALIDMACEAFGNQPHQHASDRSETPTDSAILRTMSSKPHRNGDGSSDLVMRSDTSEGNHRKRFDVVDVTRQRRRSVAANQEAKAGPKSKIGSAEPGTPMIGSTIDLQTHGPAEPIAAVDLQAARSFLFDLVVDLTGYDPEIIEFDADLEAELGVDSIKKAQLIGEMVQWADIAIDIHAMPLAKFETLNDIVGLLAEGPILAKTTSNHQSALDGLTDDVDGAFFHESPSDPPVRQAAPDLESLHRLMIDLVVDQTGYDESIIDMDADMEGELGIDSIKKAQLLGELEQQYQLQSLRDSNLSLADFSTLGSIRDFVWKQLTGGPDETSNRTLQKKNESDSAVATVSASIPVPSAGTHRFEIRTHLAPRLGGVAEQPRWYGPAVVVGRNVIADAILARWRRDPESSIHPIHAIDSSLSADELETELDALWSGEVSPHLFITTPHDAESGWSVDDPDAWKTRRQSGLLNPFRVCQRWMQGRIDLNAMPQSSLVTIVRAGGSFGFRPLGLSNQGIDSADSIAAESGGLAGLTKAMLIEAWMRGHRDTPMLVIDPLTGSSPDEVVDGVWRELAAPSYDEEVIIAGTTRMTTIASYAPLHGNDSSSATQSPSITPKGAWVIAGGGRGITALTSMELAARYGLKLHLLGTAPVPQIDESMRRAAATDRGELRRRVMAQIQSKGGNPVTTWQKLEKAIEIDQTLQACHERSIDAIYHSVDVADAEAVKECLRRIREVDGPIRGVIQGAGAGQDARFDRKRPDKVEKCFRAKVDGCVSLAAATIDDPLEWFIGFGSISGRFGANGHTDYSAANDMLAKLITQLKRQRPQTRCVTFHWHAWGDIGMATKPEAKLALDMIGMEFMPAREGLQHFLDELEHGGDLTEVLITDRRYVRKFFPEGEWVDRDQAATATFPMLDPEGHRQQTSPSSTSYAITLNPTTDRFLKEHLVHGRPTLPFVIAIEMLAEAARARHAEKTGEFLQVIACHDVRAHQSLKCLTDDAFAVELVPAGDESDRWTLVSDLRRRDGRLVQAARPHFSATIELGREADTDRWTREDLFEGHNFTVQPVVYQPNEAPVYHGPQLQCLREIGFDLSAGDDRVGIAVGLVVAPSPAHLAGEQRPLRGWSILPAAVDAVLYAAGCLAYRIGDRPNLPISFERIQVGRLPRPGEVLRVVVELSEMNQQGAILSAKLAGQNRDRIVQLDGYQIGWLG